MVEIKDQCGEVEVFKSYLKHIIFYKIYTLFFIDLFSIITLKTINIFFNLLSVILIIGYIYISLFIKKSKKEIKKQIGYDLDRISELAKDKITAIKNTVIIADIIKRLSDYMEELENGGNKRSMWRSRNI